MLISCLCFIFIQSAYDSKNDKKRRNQNAQTKAEASIDPNDSGKLDDDGGYEESKAAGALNILKILPEKNN